MIDLEKYHVCAYISHANGIMTTSCLVTTADDSNLKRQLLPEIAKFENEDAAELSIVSQPDRWTVHVPGRFSSIGQIRALAILDPPSCDPVPNVRAVFTEGGWAAVEALSGANRRQNERMKISLFTGDKQVVSVTKDSDGDVIVLLKMGRALGGGTLELPMQWRLLAKSVTYI
jgi:hypothetical protein